MQNTLKLVTYNIKNGEKLDQIIQNIKILVNDEVKLFCFQEVRKADYNENLIGSKLENALGKKWKAMYFLANKELHYDFGQGIFWDSTIIHAVDFKQLPLPKLDKLNIYEKMFDKYIVNRTIPIQRGALIGKFVFNDKPIRVTTTHLDWQGGFTHRILQLQYIKEYLKNDSAVDYEIICGDFNTIGPSKRLRKQQVQIKNILGKEFIDTTPFVSWTSYLDTINRKGKLNIVRNIVVFFGMKFYQRLDYIFVKGFKVINAKAINLQGSDHIPLIAILEI